MEIILIENVENLGKVGEIKKVKSGYARNFLLPRSLAIAATQANIKRIEKEKVKKLAKYEELKKQAQAKADELSKISLTVAVEVAAEDKLYGAVSESEILKAFEAQGQKIEKKSLVIEKHIEELGIFEIGVKLHPEVIAKIRLWVTKK